MSSLASRSEPSPCTVKSLSLGVPILLDLPSAGCQVDFLESLAIVVEEIGARGPVRTYLSATRATLRLRVAATSISQLVAADAVEELRYTRWLNAAFHDYDFVAVTQF